MKQQATPGFGCALVVLGAAFVSLCVFFKVFVEPIALALNREIVLPLNLWAWIVIALVARACVYVAASRRRLQKAAAHLAALAVLGGVAFVVSDLVVGEVYGGRYAVRRAGGYYAYTKSPKRMKRTTRRGYEIIRGWNKANQLAFAGLWLPILFVALECGASAIAPQREDEKMDLATLLGLPPRLVRGVKRVMFRPGPEREVELGPQDPAWSRTVAKARELSE